MLEQPNQERTPEPPPIVSDYTMHHFFRSLDDSAKAALTISLTPNEQYVLERIQQGDTYDNLSHLTNGRYNTTFFRQYDAKLCGKLEQLVAGDESLHQRFMAIHAERSAAFQQRQQTVLQALGRLAIPPSQRVFWEQWLTGTDSLRHITARADLPQHAVQTMLAKPPEALKPFMERPRPPLLAKPPVAAAAANPAAAKPHTAMAPRRKPNPVYRDETEDNTDRYNPAFQQARERKRKTKQAKLDLEQRLAQLHGQALIETLTKLGYDKLGTTNHRMVTAAVEVVAKGRPAAEVGQELGYRRGSAAVVVTNYLVRVASKLTPDDFAALDQRIAQQQADEASAD